MFHKGIGEISSNSKWKPIFTSNNEIILNIAGSLPNESFKYLQIAIPSIREVIGMNKGFINLHDAKVENLEVSSDDSGLESLD